MAVTPTGAIYKTLNFDGQSSGTFGVYITGDAVFNAPERDVEMVKIPGRNGAFALDNGRFENIEVTYPAGIFAETEAEFAAAISDFRNYLCSRKGYCRLTDDYNSDEYRLGIYKSGLEVDPAFLKAGQFNIVFECKPQRFLTSGEIAVALSSGDTLTNPTYFESGPLLEIEGYGTIEFNGYEIELDDDLVGDVLVEGNTFYSDTADVSFSNVYIVNGDTIDAGASLATIESNQSLYTGGAHYLTSVNITTWWGGGSLVAPNVTLNGNKFTTEINLDSITLTYGTPSNAVIYCTVKETYDNSIEYLNTFAFKIIYNGGKNISYQISGGKNINNRSIETGDIIIHSTATTYGHPTYIDCDIGEAYADDNGVISSLNSYIDLGSDLPKLAPGSNTVTFDNTITSLKITPRWWKV